MAKYRNGEYLIFYEKFIKDAVEIEVYGLQRRPTIKVIEMEVGKSNASHVGGKPGKTRENRMQRSSRGAEELVENGENFKTSTQCTS